MGLFGVAEKASLVNLDIQEFIMKKLFIVGLALVSVAVAAATGLNLEGATKLALERNTDLATSRATLANARADLVVKEADPTTLIVPLSQARNTVALNAVQLEGQKLSVFSSVLTAYISLFEAQENLGVLEAQVALDVRNLEVAKAKLAARNGTALDVSKAESTLSSSKQSLADANAQIPVLSNRLELVTGAKGDLEASEALGKLDVKLDTVALEAGLESRIGSVLQATQGVGIAELNVRLADNDYTPLNTLRDNQASLENSKRSLETSQANAVTTLRDAIRNASNARERVGISAKDLDNAKSNLEQDQARFKGGSISRITLQQTELAFTKAMYSQTQAINAYWRNLATVSTASGVDVIGLVAKLGGG
jgi:outer membrane protein